ncbi:MAG: NADH-quinone oxidoreductase subunit N [Bryobacterales bacterium]|nr:NADH-quinone oxidoreductase subunit N [Bryobacterales bacterium]
MSEFYTSLDHFAILPALLMGLFGCAIFLFDLWLFPSAREKRYLAWFVIVAEIFVGVALFRQFVYLESTGVSSVAAFKGLLSIDGFSIFFNFMFLVAALLAAMVSYRYLEEERENHGEYYALLLMAQCGMFFLASATELVSLFIGVELMTITFYVLVGFLARDKRSNEAAIKYFILGSFSSAFLAYGFSLLYGLTGSTRLAEITAALVSRPLDEPLLVIAIITTTVGVLFKLAAAPFHMWAPDVYEGAPTPVTAYLAVGSKAAAVALLLRLFEGPLASSREVWEPMIALVAIVTITVGNLGALSQHNIKRMLAYSAIAHAGYMLLGLVAGNETGIKGVVIYAFVYTFMNFGAFLVLIGLRQQDASGETMEELHGLMRRNGPASVMMLVFLVSLAGIPPTAGFIAKYFIFLALIETGHYWLALIGVLYVAVAIYYYFRVVRAMFLESPSSTMNLIPSLGLRLAIVGAGVGTIGLGVVAEPFLRLAGMSILR